MTDKKMPLTTEPVKKTDLQEPTAKATKKATTKTPATHAAPNKISKLAIIAILLAVGATAAHYFWQQQQNQTLTIKLTEQIKQKNTAIFSQYQVQIKQALNKQQQDFSKQLQQVATQISSNNQEKITALNTTVNHLEQSIKQRQPSDWLLHEAEYLIRIAARTLWLEHDTKAAIGLLKDADTRLAELNNPNFLSVRELIHQDLKSLELMPTLQTDEVVLALMALNKQIVKLPLAMVDLGTRDNEETTLALSDNINDWQSNLAKTWQKFLNDFIRVRQRSGLIEPLMSPEQQQHLKQNLSLKVQLALWAASERKADIYQKTLTDIQQWLTEFFDMKNVANQHVEQALIKLQQQRVSYDYPSELTSLAAIRTVLTKQQIKPLPQPSISSLPEPTPTENKAKKEQQIDVDVDVDNQETKLEQNSQSINEDNI